MMIEVHGVRLGGSCGNIENQQTSWIEQRRQECELPRKVGQMFENVERENAVEAMLPGSSGKIIFGVQELHGKIPEIGPLLGELQGCPFHVIVDGPVPSPG